jgi:hypothetical protein
MANPITAPYRISTSMAGNQVALAGRVGTKRVHDVAIQTAIAAGYPIRDNLTIDTAEAYRVAAFSNAPGMGGGPTAVGLTRLGVAAGGGLPYVYPPPLFGRLDNPFYGFEPPLVSYPPWWNVANYREANSNLAQVASQGPIQGPASVPYAGTDPLVSNPGGVNPGGANPPMVLLNPADQQPTVEMTIDQRGVAVLRGTVPTLADRIAIGQTIAQQPGVSEVQNLLNVGGPMPSATNTPPPPPQPAFPNAPGVAQPDPGQDAPKAGVAVDAGGELSRRLAQSIARRPALANLPIKVSGRDGVAYLSGNVPTIYEAMLAFRAAQQTPGVHEVDDRLGFEVPDGERPNPLRQKGRPEDVEPYLAAQIRRQVGDMAHVDQVRLLGDTLEIRGTLLREDDRPRLVAVLRSMPVLRGYRIEPTFQSE